MPSDFDSPWKDALDRYFPAFVHLFFPAIHKAIDWARGHEMLDKELRRVAPSTKKGRAHVDKLVKVWRRDGREAWVLVHVEVQSQVERTFPRRMYIYNYRLFDRYNRLVASLAVLADDRADWRPTSYRNSLWGCAAGIEFPVAKLLDYAGREAELAQSSNPFAVVVQAHLQTLQTRHDPATRRQRKFHLVRSLYERGFAADDVRQLFLFIDAMMALPPELTEQFHHDVLEFEEEHKMPYISSIERLAKQQGICEGMQNLLVVTLNSKFGASGKRLEPRIRRIEDVAKLEELQKLLVTSSSLPEFRAALA